MSARASNPAGEAVVMGLGATGLSLVRGLRARNWGVCAMDSRREPPGLAAVQGSAPEVDIVLGGWDEARMLAADLVAVSPGIAANEPALERARSAGIDVAGDIELFARWAAGIGAGITGTNGKSTVTALLGHLLSALGIRVLVGGNLGVPALDLLERDDASHWVLEISSFQLDLVRRIDLRCAAILNISSDHLDRYGSMEAYVASKQRIYAHAEAAVFDAEDARTWPPSDFAGTRIALHGHGAPAGEWGIGLHEDEPWLFSPRGPLLCARDLPLAGRHNAFNVLAALAMTECMGGEIEEAARHVADFQALPHRCVPVGEVRGVRFVNDSKATNVGAARAAIEGLDDGARRLVLIAGGDGKGADFTELADHVNRAVHTAVLIGRDADGLRKALDGQCTLVDAETMHQAVRLALEHARRGDTVLLAPACASFDMFASYAQRGEVFAAEVVGLMQQEAGP